MQVEGLLNLSAKRKQYVGRRGNSLWHHRPTLILNQKGLSWSMLVATRKIANYAWVRRSQRKLWWRSEAVLTCKSIVKSGYSGERLIELSSSWFPPKFSSEQLVQLKSCKVKRMIRVIGGEMPSNYSQTLNMQICLIIWVNWTTRWNALSGPSLVSRAGDAG